MLFVKLVDSTFQITTMGLAGENLGEHPESFQWDRTPGDAGVKVFTDLRLREAIDDPARKKIALLVESPAFSTEAVNTALEMREQFDVILTHNFSLVNLGKPFKFYPLGGSWLKEWDIFPKTKNISVVVGKKTYTNGQRIRHAVAELPGVDAWGEPYTEYLPSKAPMLRPYRYSVVIENARSDWYFSEKLIDCISQGTMPIYWGCPGIGKFFCVDGIIQVSTFSELRQVIQSGLLTDKAYKKRMPALQQNLKLARQYRCAEDWIFENYPGVFDVNT